MGMNAGKIISRRVNLRTDHPTLVQAVLPHEITHVILADFFTEQQIPRWADEGLAVLAEPLDEQEAAGLLINSTRRQPAVRGRRADEHGLPRQPLLVPLLCAKCVADTFSGRTGHAGQDAPVPPGLATVKGDRR